MRDELVNMMNTANPKLIIMVGLPRSGKTFFREKNFPDTKVISRDKIREESFGSKGNMTKEKEVTKIFDEQLSLAMANKETVVIDNTNINKKTRASYRCNNGHSFEKGLYEIVYIWMNTSLEITLENAKNDEFPLSVILGMDARFEDPSLRECDTLDEIYIYRLIKGEDGNDHEYVGVMSDYGDSDSDDYILDNVDLMMQVDNDKIQINDVFEDIYEEVQIEWNGSEFEQSWNSTEEDYRQNDKRILFKGAKWVYIGNFNEETEENKVAEQTKHSTCK